MSVRITKEMYDSFMSKGFTEDDIQHTIDYHRQKGQSDDEIFNNLNAKYQSFSGPKPVVEKPEPIKEQPIKQVQNSYSQLENNVPASPTDVDNNTWMDSKGVMHRDGEENNLSWLEQQKRNLTALGTNVADSINSFSSGAEIERRKFEIERRKEQRRAEAKDWLTKREEWEKSHPVISEFQKSLDPNYQPEKVRQEAIVNDKIAAPLDIIKASARPAINAGLAGPIGKVGTFLMGKAAAIPAVNALSKAHPFVAPTLTGAIAEAPANAAFGVADRGLAELQGQKPEYGYGEAALGGVLGGAALHGLINGAGRIVHDVARTQPVLNLNKNMNRTIRKSPFLTNADAALQNLVGGRSHIPAVRDEQIRQMNLKRGNSVGLQSLSAEEMEALQQINNMSKPSKELLEKRKGLQAQLAKLEELPYSNDNLEMAKASIRLEIKKTETDLENLTALARGDKYINDVDAQGIINNAYKQSYNPLQGEVDAFNKELLERQQAQSWIDSLPHVQADDPNVVRQTWTDTLPRVSKDDPNIVNRPYKAKAKAELNQQANIKPKEVEQPIIASQPKTLEGGLEYNEPVKPEPKPVVKETPVVREDRTPVSNAEQLTVNKNDIAIQKERNKEFIRKQEEANYNVKQEPNLRPVEEPTWASKDRSVITLPKKKQTPVKKVATAPKKDFVLKEVDNTNYDDVKPLSEKPENVARAKGSEYDKRTSGEENVYENVKEDKYEPSKEIDDSNFKSEKLNDLNKRYYVSKSGNLIDRKTDKPVSEFKKSKLRQVYKEEWEDFIHEQENILKQQQKNLEAKGALEREQNIDSESLDDIPSYEDRTNAGTSYDEKLSVIDDEETPRMTGTDNKDVLDFLSKVDRYKGKTREKFIVRTLKRTKQENRETFIKELSEHQKFLDGKSSTKVAGGEGIESKNIYDEVVDAITKYNIDMKRGKINKVYTSANKANAERSWKKINNSMFLKDGGSKTKRELGKELYNEETGIVTGLKKKLSDLNAHFKAFRTEHAKESKALYEQNRTKLLKDIEETKKEINKHNAEYGKAKDDFRGEIGGEKAMKYRLKNSKNPQGDYDEYLKLIESDENLAYPETCRLLAEQLNKAATESGRKINIKPVPNYKTIRQNTTIGLLKELKLMVEMGKNKIDDAFTSVKDARKFMKNNKLLLNWDNYVQTLRMTNNKGVDEKGIDILRFYSEEAEKTAIHWIDKLTSTKEPAELVDLLNSIDPYKYKTIVKPKDGKYDVKELEKAALDAARDIYKRSYKFIKQNHTNRDIMTSMRKDKNGQWIVHDFDNTTSKYDANATPSKNGSNVNLTENKLDDSWKTINDDLTRKIDGTHWKDNPDNPANQIKEQNRGVEGYSTVAKNDLKDFTKTSKYVYKMNDDLVEDAIEKGKLKTEDPWSEKSDYLSKLSKEERINFLKKKGWTQDALDEYKKYVDKEQISVNETIRNEKLIKAKKEKDAIRYKKELEKDDNYISKDMDDYVRSDGTVKTDKLFNTLRKLKDENVIKETALKRQEYESYDRSFNDIVEEVRNDFEDIEYKLNERYGKFIKKHTSSPEYAASYLATGEGGEYLVGKEFTINQLVTENNGLYNLTKRGLGDTKVKFYSEKKTNVEGFYDLETGDINLNVAKKNKFAHEIVHLLDDQTEEGHKILLNAAKKQQELAELKTKYYDTRVKVTKIMKEQGWTVDTDKLFVKLANYKKNGVRVLSDEDIANIREIKKLQKQVENSMAERRADAVQGGEKYEQYGTTKRDKTNVGRSKEDSTGTLSTDGGRGEKLPKRIYSQEGSFLEGQDWKTPDNVSKEVADSYRTLREVSEDSETMLERMGILDRDQIIYRKEMVRGKKNLPIYVSQTPDPDKSTNIEQDYAAQFMDKIGLYGKKESKIKQSVDVAKAAATMIRNHKIKDAEIIANDVMNSKFAKPIVDGKVEKGYKKVNDKLLKTALVGGKSSDWLETMLGGEETIKKAFKGEEGAIQYWVDFVKNNDTKDYQIPTIMYKQLLSGRGETPAEYVMRYCSNDENFEQIAKGKIKGALKYARAYNELFLNLFKRDVLTTSSFFVNNRIGNAVMMVMAEDNPLELIDGLLSYGSIDNIKLPPRVVENSIMDILNDFKYRKKYTGDAKIDNLLNAMTGQTVDVNWEGFKNLSGKDKVITTAENSLALYNKAINAVANTVGKINQKFETAERKVLFLHKLNKYRKAKIKATGDQMITQQEALKMLNDDPKEMEAILSSIEDTLGDYNSYSKMEREVLRQIFPFYSWTRTIARHIYKNVEKNPTRYAMLALEYYRMRKRDEGKRKKYQEGILNTGLVDERSKEKLGINFVNSSANPFNLELPSLHPGATLAKTAIKGEKEIGSFKSRKYLEKTDYKTKKKYFIDKEGKRYDSLPADARIESFLVGMVRHMLSTNNRTFSPETLISALTRYNKTGKWEWNDTSYDDSFGGYRTGDDFGVDAKGKKTKQFSATALSNKTKTINYLFGNKLQPIRKLNKTEQAKYKKKIKEQRIKEYKKYEAKRKRRGM